MKVYFAIFFNILLTSLNSDKTKDLCFVSELLQRLIIFIAMPLEENVSGGSSFFFVIAFAKEKCCVVVLMSSLDPIGFLPTVIPSPLGIFVSTC